MKLRIREEMNRQKISGPKLAEMTGIKYRTLDEFLRRESGNFINLVKIADALGVSMDFLVGREEGGAPPGQRPVPPAEEPPEQPPGREDVIADLPDHELHGILRDLALRYQEEEPDLAWQASRLRDTLYTKFRGDIAQAESLLPENRELAQKLYANAFLAATPGDMADFRKSQIEMLLGLCRELGDSATAGSLAEKYTSASYRDKKKHLVILASVLADCGFIGEAEQVMEAVR